MADSSQLKTDGSSSTGFEYVLQYLKINTDLVYTYRNFVELNHPVSSAFALRHEYAGH